MDAATRAGIERLRDAALAQVAACDALLDAAPESAVDPDEISVGEAAFIVKKDQTTVIRWARRYGIGWMSGGRWIISRRALEAARVGDAAG